MAIITTDRSDNPAGPARRGTTPMLEFDRVSFAYTQDLPILEDFSLQIHEGESWGILGTSGIGKTTLLYLVAGLRQPQEGQVRFRGVPLRGPNKDVGLMLQDYGLLPWMTAERNVQLGLKIRGVTRRERHRIRAEWLERMEIGHIARQYPAQLSGGQRQRVALARVLALQTDVLLLDEPLSAVDELTRERLQKTLWQIRAELQVTMLLVTHSIEEAALLTDHILIFPEDMPLRAPTVLRSPFANGTMPDRADPQFQQFCAQIRRSFGL